jgi:hypothetical protein
MAGDLNTMKTLIFEAIFNEVDFFILPKAQFYSS